MLIFINNGEIVLDTEMANISEQFVEVLVDADKLEEAKQYSPIYSRDVMGRKTFVYEGQPREKLAHLGELHTPGLSDLFVAKMKQISYKEEAVSYE